MAKQKKYSVISYNVNGIRAALGKGFAQWLEETSPDVICLQETKASPDQVDTSLFEHLGYHHHWHSAEKKGYSGVAILSKEKPKHVEIGCGLPEYDREGRIIRADFDSFSIVNTYFPSGSSGDERQDFKMRFLNDYIHFINEVKKSIPNLLVAGDYNICHKPIDIHDPVSNKNSSGFLPEERAWMDTFFEMGLVDTFRKINQEPHQYSWWSYRAGARARNKGWRIDYISVSASLEHAVQDAAIYPDVIHSDHCPIYVSLK